MHSTGRDVLVAVAGGLSLVAYSAYLVQHVPMGLTRLLISLSLVLLIGLVAGASMKGSLVAQVGVILLVPFAHFLYEGVDAAKPTLSVIWYVAELLLLWIGLLIAHFVFRRQHGTNAPAA